MAYARVVSGMVCEVIDYNPYEVINENFHHMFHPCPDEVKINWIYDENTQTYIEPDQ